MAGAIADIMKNVEDVTDMECAAAKQAYDSAKAAGLPNASACLNVSAKAAGLPNASACLNVSVNLPSVPLMSISKQIEDL